MKELLSPHAACEVTNPLVNFSSPQDEQEEKREEEPEDGPLSLHDSLEATIHVKAQDQGSSCRRKRAALEATLDV